MRHWIDRPGGAGCACGGIASGYRKRVPPNRLDDEAIGRRRQSVTNAKVHVKDAELEIRHGEQGVLLICELCKASDFAKIGIIFESYKQIMTEISRHAGCRRKVRLTIFSEADVHDRVDDEFVVRVTNPDNRPYLQTKPCLGEFWSRVAQFEIDAVEKAALLGRGRNKQGPHLEGVREKLLIPDSERQIQPDFPPVGHAVGEFWCPVDAVIGDEATRKWRRRDASTHIVEMLLNRELAWSRNAGVVNLDFVDGLRWLSQRDPEDGAGQQMEMASGASSETTFYHGSTLSLRGSDQNADGEHDSAAEHDLEHRLQERGVHISRADIGDSPEFEEHHDARDRGGDPERIGPRIRNQIGQCVAETADRGHGAAGDPAQPG